MRTGTGIDAPARAAPTVSRDGLAAVRKSILFGLLGISSCPVVLAETNVRGVDEPMLANVMALMGIDDEPCDAPAWRVAQSFEDARGEIRTALEAFGYYVVVVDQRFEQGEDCWTAEFDVSLGDPVQLRSIDIEITGEAREDAAFDEVSDVPALAVGQPLLHAEYDRLKDTLMSLAQERGYSDARFATARIDVYPREYAADIELSFESGARYRFGDISVEQEALDEELIRTYMDFRKGDYYDGRALTDLQIDLSNTGYFDNVSVRPLPADPENMEIPILVTMQPAPRKFLSYGIGASTDIGVQLRLGRSIRRFNEKGHQLNLNAQLSPVISEITANYRMPYGDPRSEWVSFDAGGKREETDTSTSNSLEFGARRVVRKKLDWFRTDFMSLLVEDFEIGDQKGRSRLLMPGIEWSRLRADNTLRPDKGSNLEIALRGAADSLGSDTSFVQLHFEGRWIWSVGRAGRILTRSELGGTLEDGFRNLPPSVRFFAGGDNSVRGYDFETLGPVNDDGEVIGGPRIFTASLEYEYSLGERWSVATFLDAGNAFESSDLDMHSGVGIGTRWQSPLGPVRLDIAKPLDGLDRDLRVHIRLGPDL